ESLRRKGPLIGNVLDLHGNGFASPVPGPRLDADQDRIAAHLHCLQRSGEFVAVPWRHAIVMIGGGNERWWIADALLHIVIGRVGIQRAELLRILAEPI